MNIQWSIKTFVKSNITKFILVTFVVFTLYSVNSYSDFKSGDWRRLVGAGDVIPNSFLGYNLLRYKSFYFDESVQHLRRFENWYSEPVFLIKSKERYVSVYPVFTGIVSMPVFIVPYLLGKISQIGDLYSSLKVLFLARIAASFITALSAGFIYLSINKINKVLKLKVNNLLPLIFVLFYSFGTTNFSISSRSLWQHTSVVLCFSLSFYFLLLLISEKNRKYSYFFSMFIGLALSCAFLSRTLNIVAFVVFGLFIFKNKKEVISGYILGAFPLILLLLFYNKVIFGSFFIEGYSFRNDLSWSANLMESVPGLLFSPARSFLFISPPLVLSFYFIYKIFRDKNYTGVLNVLLKYSSIVFLTCFFIYAKWYTWHGGSGFGYRMLTDFLPFLICFSYITFVKHFYKFRLLIFSLIIYSVLIQFNAVYFLKSMCSSEHNWDFYCLSPRVDKINELINRDE